MGSTLICPLCKQCAGPVPEFYHGKGEWYITASNAERGPYCSEECVKQAKREER